MTVPKHAGSEEYFRALLDSAPDAIVVVDSLGRIVLVNAQTERIFGYHRDELLGQRIEILVPDKAKGKHRGHRAEFFAHPTARPMGASLELHGRRKDGSEFPVEISLSPLQTSDGLLVSSAIRDITDRKRTESRFRALLDSAPDAMVVVDHHGRIVLVNSQTERLFGYSREELLGQPVEALVPERFWHAHRKHRAAFICHPQVRPMGAGLELYGQRKDGTEFPLEISLSPQQTEEGVLVSSTIRDISERKRIEDALRQSEASFRALVESNYGLYQARPDGEILSANQSMVKMLGYDSVSELTRRNLAADIFVEGTYSPQLFAPHGARRGFENVEATWRHKDGRLLTVQLTGRPVRDERGENLYFEVIAEDVTLQRGIEMRLRQVQKMEAVGRLAGGVAHDFNNLLGVILGYTEMMEERAAGDETLRNMLSEIRTATDRASALTRQLLTFSRQQVTQPQVVRLNDAIRNMEKMLRRLIGEDIEVIVRAASDAGCVKVDPAQLEQVIMNLAVNARDAMPDGGKLTIETSRVLLDHEYCARYPDVRAGEYALLAVTDNGIGMDPDTQMRAFEPFFTTKEPGRGTGLGLATVYGVVRQSGGHINLYSEQGQGTTFRVYLPRVAESPVTAPPVSHSAAIGGNETILLVEDEEAMRRMARSFLQTMGYTVLEAADARAALELLETHGEAVHLLITDVVLPGLSGPKLAHQVAARHPHIKVLFVSGYTADAIMHHGVLESGVEFLSKPFTPSVLATKVRATLDREETR